ncbi:MAG: DNA mismatch repair endonuclease MutL [Eubacteriales bacterium]|nr:DNA mismatch repair endonuclease MutL [Eubacteriales bacterium]
MIRILTKDTIDKIAAGEVVEKPVNVVKELVDNSLDSGASSISVEIRNGGTSLIRVTDNGSGIAKEDLPKAFIRHATSKIQNADDLTDIRTMGFRGEALSSISAVSRTEVMTKKKGDLFGYRYFSEGGVEKGPEEIGIPDGTTMLVRDLFFNIPVRKRFLKSERVETSAIRDMVEKFAIGSPDVSFSLIIDGKQVLHTTGNGKLKDVIYTVYGPEMTKDLVTVDHTEEGMRITGFVSKPNVSRSKREYEVIYVNGRHVSDRNVSEAIETAYEGYLMQHRFPFAVLMIDIDPSKIDVNIHPKKEEIRFSDTEAVSKAVYRAVKEALEGKELIPEVTLSKKAPDAEKEKTPLYRAEPFEQRLTEKKRALSYPDHRENKDPMKAFGETERELVREALSEPKMPAPVQLSFLDTAAKPYYRYLGQFFNTYCLIEYQDHLYMIDQHAAHEKVLYERLSRQIRENMNDHPASQNILPVILSLPKADAEVLSGHMDVFCSIGFEMEEAGDNDFIVRAVPASLPSLSEKDLLMDMLDMLSEDSTLPKDPVLLKNRIASMSCKAAVKAGMRLSDIEIRSLIDELLTLEDPYHCPHGRPVIIQFSRNDIDKMFKRIV